MINIGDPKQLVYLRDLPSGYLLDLLAKNDDLDETLIRQVLQERGYAADDINRGIGRRQDPRRPGRPTLWRLARWATLSSAIIIALFNLHGFQQLLQSEDAARLPLLFLIVTCAGFGFFLGYKMSTHVYQGGASQLCCGFPLSVGLVDLETGTETTYEPVRLIVSMSVNAVVGVNFTVFPVILIHQLIS